MSINEINGVFIGTFYQLIEFHYFIIELLRKVIGIIVERHKLIVNSCVRC